MGTLARYMLSIAAVLFIALPADANEGFMQNNCAKLGLGIHQKVERYESQDGSDQLVVYSLFCGVRLQAHGQRALTGGNVDTAGYGVSRHWGYIEYTPTSESVTRRAVETGERSTGTWETRSSGLHNIVVLHAETGGMNGNWSYCTATTRDRCRDEPRGERVGESARMLPPEI